MPTAPAQPVAPNDGDLFVLNYALTLEHLENAFYKEALAKFPEAAFTAAGLDAGIRRQMEFIAAHEATHVATLSTVIESTFGAGKAVAPCEYQFPLDSITTFVAVAAALERTGVSAYDGAIKFITADTIKTAGASIATIEGRHASLLNVLNTQRLPGQNVLANVNPIPAPFDTPLGFTPVLSIAAPFIKACPFQLPVQPFSALQLSRPTGNLQETLGLLFTATLSDDQ
ncbi:ferritin-like domain-containing protein, partial [Phlyctochytrium arcticum]